MAVYRANLPFDEFLKNTKELKKKKVKVGYVDSTKVHHGRPVRSADGKIYKKNADPISMGRLALVHEFGCVIWTTPAQRGYLALIGFENAWGIDKITIPARPFIVPGFNDRLPKVFNDTLPALRAVATGAMGAGDYLELFGMMMAGEMKAYAVEEVKSPPNSPMTVAMKGSSNPLSDTGNMINSMSWKVE